MALSPLILDVIAVLGFFATIFGIIQGLNAFVKYLSGFSAVGNLNSGGFDPASGCTISLLLIPLVVFFVLDVISSWIHRAGLLQGLLHPFTSLQAHSNTMVAVLISFGAMIAIVAFIGVGRSVLTYQRLKKPGKNSSKTPS